MWQTVRPGQVMVGDDEIHSSPTCALCRSKGAGARIHTDHQPNACCRRALDYIAPQVVAVSNAMWDVEICGAAT